MPILRSCWVPTCPLFRPCPEHGKHPPSRRDRPGASARGYGRRWEKYRRGFLARNPICVGCRREPAIAVDHIQPIQGPQDPIFWTVSNHQALCISCHSRKTGQDRAADATRKD